MNWPVYDAKARFSEFLNAALKKGPQVVTRRGVETAVLVPIEEWKRLQTDAKPSLIEILRDPRFPFDLDIPPRRKLVLRGRKSRA